LQNVSDDYVVFKVKTTAPKQYCVRPNSGKIAPNGAVEVQVLLQPLKEIPPGYKCKDKFLVQSGAVNPIDTSTSFNDIWSGLERDQRRSLEERKIRVIFEEPTSNAPSIVTGENYAQPYKEAEPGVLPVMKVEGNYHQEKSEPAIASVRQEKNTGVPVYVTFLLCLFSFLVAYFLF